MVWLLESRRAMETEEYEEGASHVIVCKLPGVQSTAHIRKKTVSVTAQVWRSEGAY
jgi:hypothetical protein